MPFDPTDLSRCARADAGLVVAQLSYRAQVTRRAPPVLHAALRAFGPFGDDPKSIMDWTDERISYAASHETLPAVHDPFPQRVNHNAADSYLTVAQVAFRGGLSASHPSPELIEVRYGSFSSPGPKFTLRWTDQRMREAVARLKQGEWTIQRA